MYVECCCILAVWPDWAFHWTLGNFLKPFAIIILPKSPTILIFVKVSKSFIFYWNQFWATFKDIWRFFSGHTASLPEVSSHENRHLSSKVINQYFGLSYLDFLNCFDSAKREGWGFSVTRFCKISPLWQKLPSLWPMIDGSFLIWQNAEPTLAICDTIWLIFTAANGQILKNNITIIWSHLRVLTHVYLLHLWVTFGGGGQKYRKFASKISWK